MDLLSVKIVRLLLQTTRNSQWAGVSQLKRNGSQDIEEN